MNNSLLKTLFFSFFLSACGCASAQNNIQSVIDKIIDNMVYVRGGTFTMGATAEQGNDAYDDEKPAHSVTVSSFMICRYEVTQAEWEAVMGSNPSYIKGSDRPVECVSWKDCQKFIKKLNAASGYRFRLPTEAEWEYAARGGRFSRGYKYAGGSDIGSVAWYSENSYAKGENSPDYGTHDVGTKRPNELGIYDMSGNVLEWCSDWYGKEYYGSSPSGNPKGPGTGSRRVCRGGGWYGSGAGDCRVAFRFDCGPGHRFNVLGLRLVLSE